jgi:hypothetical protein
MKHLICLSVGLMVAGCGFKFSLGTNPYGAPLAPLVIDDRAGQGLGEALKRYLPGQLAKSGLTTGAGEARRLSVTISPWERTTLYNTIDRRAVVFGEQFSVRVSARVQGQGRVIRLAEIVTLAPDRGLDGRALNLQRVADSLAHKLASRLAEALE